MKLEKLILTTLGVIIVTELIDAIIGDEHDTINYALQKKERVVYHGITYEDRLDARLIEHEKAGKRFDLCIYDHAKPRKKAFRLEKNRIKKDAPKYNIHHNCN